MNLETQEYIFDLLRKERVSQDAKHGHKNVHIKPFSHKPLTLIMEELGEAAQALDDLDNEEDSDLKQELIKHYKSELVQTGGLVVQALERIINAELAELV